MPLRLTSSLDLSVKRIIASKATMENDASNFEGILVKILSYTEQLFLLTGQFQARFQVI
jgi:hypothetical protein